MSVLYALGAGEPPYLGHVNTNRRAIRANLFRRKQNVNTPTASQVNDCFALSSKS